MSENRSNQENEERLHSAFVALKRNLQSQPRARPAPPDYELMQAYVNNTASALDREIIESYAELHPQFAKELSDLQAFAAMMQEEEVAEKPPDKEPSWWARWVPMASGWRLSGASLALRAGINAAVLLLVGVSAFVAWQLSRINTSPEIAKIDYAPPMPANPPVPQTGNSNVAPPTPETLPQPETSTTLIAVHVFLGSKGGKSKALAIGQDTQTVRLLAELPDADAAGKRFRATLVTPDNEYQNLGEVRAGKASIVVNVPARRFSVSGTYALKLKAVPPSEDDVEPKYPFTVKKP